ncbi:MAG TPA: fused MFS/spermidine synthase [Chloroflexota bacterium]|nr:fused MFS/spermidine synthase [Chloroflexota bacterium]
MPQDQWKTFSKRRGERTSLQLVENTSPLLIRTAFQALEIVDTVSYGRCLFLDEKIQSAIADEFIYHEALVQPAMVAHPAPRRVFIAGGGEGATAREVLRHPTVESVIMVDIDEAAVRACRTYLTDFHQGAFADPRLTLVYDDARAAIERSDTDFDVVIVDVTDPLAGGPSYRIFTREFYALVRAHLRPNGLIAVQAESGDHGVLEGHVAIVKTLASVFPRATGYRAHVPSFGETWGFAVAGLERLPTDLSECEINQILAERGINGLRFYDGLTHRALFSPDRYYRDALSRATSLIDDAHPLVIE